MSIGKHIIVTGGGTGAGAAIAHALAGQGYDVTIMGRSAETLAQQGLSYSLCDVTKPQSVAEAFDKARRNHGPISGVIANAGAAESAPFSKTSTDMLHAMLAVNLVGVSTVWQAALPDMKEAGGGRMIAIASTAGLKGFPYVSAYCAAKHGVIGLTRALALELAPTGITVNAICPGFMETPMLDRSIATIVEKTGMNAEDARSSLCASNPQRRFIQTDEIAGTVAWLFSDAARSVNGQAISISGGEI